MLVSQCVAQNFLVMELKLLDLIVVVVKSAVNSVSDFIFHSNSQNKRRIQCAILS